MKKLFLLLIYFFAFAYMATAQNALPDTDIFICDVELKNGKYSFTNLKNITNREGYDNQPSFINNSTILYTSIREDKQADIYKIDLATGKITQITKTPEDEYSPTLMPDGKHISTVRVEKDSTQRLWKFPLANPNDFSLVFPKLKGVGYHAWLNDSVAALFVISKPFSIYISEIYRNEVRKIDDQVGRAVQRISDMSLAYVNKNDSDLQGIWISNKILNKTTWHTSFKMNLPAGSEDFIYGPDSAFYVNDGTRLLRCDFQIEKKWHVIKDFKGTKAEHFYRIAFSPDGKKLALVSYVGKKP